MWKDIWKEIEDKSGGKNTRISNRADDAGNVQTVLLQSVQIDGGSILNIRGVNKRKGSKRRWGDDVIVMDGNGRKYRYRWLLVGTRSKGTLKRRLMRSIDGEWWPVMGMQGKWQRVK